MGDGMLRPIRLVHADGYVVQIAELEDGGQLRVTVTAPTGRSWTGDRELIEDAIGLGLEILSDQRALAAPPAAESAADAGPADVIGEQVALPPPQTPPDDVERQVVPQVAPLA